MLFGDGRDGPLMGLWRRLSILPTIALRERKALREPDLFLEPSYSRGVHNIIIVIIIRLWRF
jgi:hypothetical protein